MLFIFRKLRRSFFLPGKVRTYLAYAVGEIVLIVVGILIALQISEWNQERRDGMEEREILSRISEEAETEMSNLPRLLDRVESKREALRHVDLVFKGQPVEDAMAFLAEVAVASVYGWGQPPMLRITFDEFTSSGKLGLVQDISLRNRIVAYYDSARAIDVIGRSRVGEFATTAYALVPIDRGFTVKEGSPKDYYASIANLVLKSDLDQHITSEQNRADWLKLMWQDLLEEGTALIAEIDSELAP
jgi:hypothetical protein